jgi:hypothetical protein
MPYDSGVAVNDPIVGNEASDVIVSAVAAVETACFKNDDAAVDVKAMPSPNSTTKRASSILLAHLSLRIAGGPMVPPSATIT